jgi:hypothetical protein
VQGSPPRRAAAAPVPSQHAPAEARPEPDDDSGAAGREVRALPGPRTARGIAGPLPTELLPGARAVTLRTRQPPRPDVVVFTAACPACGQDCAWSEERDDTRLRTVVTCPCAG